MKNFQNRDNTVHNNPPEKPHFEMTDCFFFRIGCMLLLNICFILQFQIFSIYDLT